MPLRWQDYVWLLLLSGATLMIWLFNRKKRRQRKAPQRRGTPLTRREQKAWHRLEAGGYRLEEIHPAVPVVMTAGGRARDFYYEGNFLVSKGGEVFLVKMNKGENPLVRASLRRELLLDNLFFQTDGILFYDEEKETVEEVRFAFRGAGGGGRERLIWKGALILLIIVGALYLGYLLWDSLL